MSIASKNRKAKEKRRVGSVSSLEKIIARLEFHNHGLRLNNVRLSKEMVEQRERSDAIIDLIHKRLAVSVRENRERNVTEYLVRYQPEISRIAYRVAGVLGEVDLESFGYGFVIRKLHGNRDSDSDAAAYHLTKMVDEASEAIATAMLRSLAATVQKMGGQK